MVKIPKSKRRQHTATPSVQKQTTEQKPKAEVKPIPIDAMIIVTPYNKKAYFRRLKYKGCPPIAHAGKYVGKFSPNTVLIDMQRDQFVKDMYELFTSEDVTVATTTLKSHFEQLIAYVVLLDIDGRSADFSDDNVDWVFKQLTELYDKGEVKKRKLANFRKMFSFVLKQQGEHKRAKDLPRVEGVGKEGKNKESLTPGESKVLYAIMNRAYKEYAKHLTANTTPTICPIFNEKLIRSMKNSDGEPLYTKMQLGRFRQSAKVRVVGQGDWRNMMVKLAFFISARWSGGNLTPLANLQRRDVLFKKFEGDNYELVSIKGRDNFQEQPIGLGFNKQTKEFIESWLQVSEKIAPGDNDWLFPAIGENGRIIHIGLNPQGALNKALKPYGLSVNTRKLRNTRSNFHMRATGDLVKVAEANRNTIETTAKTYLDGDKTTEEIQLAGAFVAQERIMKGGDKKEVIEEVAAKFKDPLSDFEYKKKTGKVANKTTNGTRCADPLGERAKKSTRKYRGIKGSGAANDNELDPCIDFLECFECPHHVLISEVDDIWLMLSFKDSLIETRARPSFNSIPTDKGEKLLTLVDAALHKFKEASPGNYKEAVEKHKSAPHPLYDDEHAIEDMMEIYK